MSERFQIISTGDPDAFIIWDREAEQVIDVLTAEERERYGLHNDLTSQEASND